MSDSVDHYKKTCAALLASRYEAFKTSCDGLRHEQYINLFTKHYVELSTDLHRISLQVLEEKMTREPDELIDTIRNIKDNALDRFRAMTIEAEQP